jgi:CRISPR-associated endonuclease Csn1
MKIRFAFDLGTSSLGWAVYALGDQGQPNELIDCGARIFSDGRDPQTGESNAQDRREPRAMRRSRDRYLQRRKYVIHELIQAGLMPEDAVERKKLVDLDPYILRAFALKEALPEHHIGRALFHLNQRRGFKSNRKTDNPDESGKIASAAKRLREDMDTHETLGSFLAARQAHEDVRQRKQVRIRMDATNKEELYEFYPMRQMLEDEFDLICQRQTQFNPDFPDDEKIAAVRKAIFDQRPLKEVKPGYCSFYDDQFRLARAHPLAEDFVYYQKINQLYAWDEDGYKIEITMAQRDQMIANLQSGIDLTWTRARKILEMPGKTGRINFEEGGEKKVEGSALTKRFQGTDKKPGPFHSKWKNFTPEQVEIILTAYGKSNTDEELLEALSEFNLNKDQQALAVKCSLPDGYIAVCERAAREITTELKKEIIPYSEAAKRAGLHHSDKRDGEIFDRLPYYNEVDELKRHLGYGTGDPKDTRDIRYGRIANPTVHIGLNQIRRVINVLMDKHGRPSEIVLELSRQLKQSKRQKDEYSKNRNKNKAVNDKRRQELEKAGFYQPGDRRRTREAFTRLRLWEELSDSPNDRFCPYSGKPIHSITMLMSDQIEIEHILPRSRTLDDSMSNKTVAYRQWNRLKRNLTPSEAAAHYPDKFNQDDMISRTKTMPPNKRWRFLEDAKERFDDEEEFLGRQLNETQYLGKITRHYLSKINPASSEQGEMKVWVTTGRLTAELRRKWGLNLGTNYKNRNDHRHHALDACVIGVIDRSMVQKIARAAARDEEDQKLGRILSHIEQPYEGYSDQVNAKLRTVIISHRPDHRISGQLHEDAAYGLAAENEENINRGEPDIGNVVIRRAVSSLTPKQIGQVRDLQIREALEAVLYQAMQSWPEAKDLKKNLPLVLGKWSRETGTRRVRTLKPEAGIVPIGKRKDGSRYKYVTPGSNHHMDIIETPDGKWHGIAQSVFEANHEQWQKKKGIAITEKWKTEYPDAKFIMRVHKGDTLQLFDDDGVNQIKRVVILHAANNCLWLSGHHDAGQLPKRHADKDDPFRWDFANIGKLKARRARRVRVDQRGRVHTAPHGSS